VIKASPDEDLYVVWSSVVDDAVAAGTAREVLEFLNQPGEWPHDAGVAEALAARAAARGGSRDTVWGKPALVCGGKGYPCRGSASGSTYTPWSAAGPPGT
jgi:hypothetical protein